VLGRIIEKESLKNHALVPAKRNTIFNSPIGRTRQGLSQCRILLDQNVHGVVVIGPNDVPFDEGPSPFLVREDGSEPCRLVSKEVKIQGIPGSSGVDVAGVGHQPAAMKRRFFLAATKTRIRTNFRHYQPCDARTVRAQ
jgi:hypothetical protein